MKTLALVTLLLIAFVLFIVCLAHFFISILLYSGFFVVSREDIGMEFYWLIIFALLPIPFFLLSGWLYDKLVKRLKQDFSTSSER